MDTTATPDRVPRADREVPATCGLCGNPRLALRYPEIMIDDPGARPPVRSRDLYRCTRCRSLWSRLPAGVGDDRYYRDKPTEDHDLLEGGVARFERVRDRIERALGRAEYSILDVGSAGGAHLCVYRDAVERFAVEPAESAHGTLAGRGIDVLGRYVHEVEPDREFDVVTCLDVLEHVEQPLPLLERMVEAVRPGGLLVLVTGNIDSIPAKLGGRRWLYYALPEHCSFYSAEAIGRALRPYGMALEDRTWIANQDVDTRYVRAFVRAVARECVFRVLPKERARSLEHAGRGRFPFFCDNMLLVFRKSSHAVLKRPLPTRGVRETSTA